MIKKKFNKAIKFFYFYIWKSILMHQESSIFCFNIICTLLAPSMKWVPISFQLMSIIVVNKTLKYVFYSNLIKAYTSYNWTHWLNYIYSWSYNNSSLHIFFDCVCII